MSLTKWRLRPILGSLAFLLVVLIVASELTGEYSRVDSPDGQYYAIARYYLYEALVPMMPGGGGDKSGHVTIYTREGRSCGQVPVDIVSRIYDLQWSPGRAEIRLVASWD